MFKNTCLVARDARALLVPLVFCKNSGYSAHPAMSPDPVIPRFLGVWELLEPLGSGYSGTIFRAYNVHTGQVVALKVQAIDHECPTNKYEQMIYPLLQGGKGMPTLWASGVYRHWSYLAIDLLGSSLDRLYKSSGKDTMDLRSVCCIAMQLIERLEFMHSRGVLHRDIQLGNCTIGLTPSEKTIYMIDFGFGKRYIDPNTRRHIPDSKTKRDFVGNYWFSSVGVHCRGKVPSRRDDMEALALMLIHLLTPRGLSWTRNGVPKTDIAHERLKREKRAARPEDLCRGLPTEFEEFLRYCRRLNFYDQPNYKFWIDEFRSLALESGFPADYDFIWPPPALIPAPSKPAVKGTYDVADILADLKGLRLNTILPGRKEPSEVERPAQNDEHRKQSNNQEVIEISSSSEDEAIPQQPAVPKRVQLMKLMKRASVALDNKKLSGLVHEFINILQCNSSRTLTKEASDFLDAMCKQLGNPSVFIVPLRTSRSQSSHASAESSEPFNAKLGTVARLCRDVKAAPNNSALADMVAEFGRVTNKSSGRTITKNGFAFLDGLSRRLSELG